MNEHEGPAGPGGAQRYGAQPQHADRGTDGTAPPPPTGTVPPRPLTPGDIGLVALGGAAGTLARYLLNAAIGEVAGLPVGILIINVGGAFLLGCLLEWLALGGPDRGARRRWRLLLGTGVLGGFTTYSLLATDIAELLLGGQWWLGVGYGLGTLVLGGLAAWAGVLVARGLRPGRAGSARA